MNKIAWSKDLTVGVAEIDEQHRQWIQRLNDVAAAIAAHQGPVQLGQTLAFLVDYTQQHFATEEKLMAAVKYPGLKSSPYYQLAQKYLPLGQGAVATFGIKGGLGAGRKLIDNVKLFSHLANLGDSKSLIIHPASTTHRQLSADELVKAGAGPEVVRLSIGIEDTKDIIADLEQAMAA